MIMKKQFFFFNTHYKYVFYIVYKIFHEKKNKGYDENYTYSFFSKHDSKWYLGNFYVIFSLFHAIKFTTYVFFKIRKNYFLNI